MSMSVSSRRVAYEVPAKSSFHDSKVLSALSCVAGIAALYCGAVNDSVVLASIGFAAFTLPFMYLNSMFWAKVLKDAPQHTEYKYYGL